MAVSRDRFEIDRFGGVRSIVWGVFLVGTTLLPRVCENGEVEPGLRILLGEGGTPADRAIIALMLLTGVVATILGLAGELRSRGGAVFSMTVATVAAYGFLCSPQITSLRIGALYLAFGAYSGAVAVAAKLPRSRASRKAHMAGAFLLLLGGGVAFSLPGAGAGILVPKLYMPILCGILAIGISLHSAFSDLATHHLTWTTRLIAGVTLSFFVLGQFVWAEAGDAFNLAGSVLPWCAILLLFATSLADLALGRISAAEAVRDRENFGRLLGYLERYDRDAKFGRERSCIRETGRVEPRSPEPGRSAPQGSGVRPRRMG